VVAFLLPVLFIILYVCIEGCRFIAILQGLDQGARQAARNLATAYATDKGIVNDTQAQVTYGFAPVQVPGVINDPAQFDAPVWDNVPGAGNQAIDPSIPQSVTVFVTYKSAGSHTLPPFPDIDPLNLRPTLRLKQSATYIIEGGG
jgi:Flp pilus assembly protein TadG